MQFTYIRNWIFTTHAVTAPTSHNKNSNIKTKPFLNGVMIPLKSQKLDSNKKRAKQTKEVTLSSMKTSKECKEIYLVLGIYFIKMVKNLVQKGIHIIE